MAQAKARLSDFDFSKEGCHISLVSKEVGGAANGRTALVFKSLSQKETSVSVEMIEKSAVEALVIKAVEEAVSPLQEIIKAKEAEIESLKQAEKETIAKARLEKITEAVGTEKADEIMKAVGALPEEQFSAVLKSLAATPTSDMFKEVGVGAEEKSQTVEKSHFKNFLPLKKETK